jgi:hypothetical protein
MSCIIEKVPLLNLWPMTLGRHVEDSSNEIKREVATNTLEFLDCTRV